VTGRDTESEWRRLQQRSGPAQDAELVQGRGDLRANENLFDA
jgi:hypothetical protein